MALHFVLSALEPSADELGAELMQQLQKQHPDAIFSGIAGPKMRALGAKADCYAEELAVMGFSEVISHLPFILRTRKQVYQTYRQQAISAFIGIDAPDFNLGLAQKLKAEGIPTIQYVSPTVWAWRARRIYKIARAIDLMLCLFPFELSYYQQAQVKAAYVGHPLAEKIQPGNDQIVARKQLGIDLQKPTLALLPGSRQQELTHLARVFLQTAQLCQEKVPQLQVITAQINQQMQQQVQQLGQELGIQVSYHFGAAQTVMMAADVILLASGTATLEAMLHQRLMVVAYKMSRLNYTIAKNLVRIPHVALPNILAGSNIVPEYIQEQAEPQQLAQALIPRLLNPKQYLASIDKFQQLHQQLALPASQLSAQAILNLVDEKTYDHSRS